MFPVRVGELRFWEFFEFLWSGSVFYLGRRAEEVRAVRAVVLLPSCVVLSCADCVVWLTECVCVWFSKYEGGAGK